MEEKEYLKYSKDYSDNRFWKTVKKYAKKIGLIPLANALALYYLLKKGNITRIDKAKIIGALGYLISPFDIVPDITPIVGLTDDGGILYLVIKTLKNKLDDSIVYDVYLKLNEWFSVELEEVRKILIP